MSWPDIIAGKIISKDRFFDQPININKLQIQILDEYGNVMDIGMIDISLTLEICTVRNSYIKTFMSIIIGSIIIFALGVLYLGSIIGYNKAIQAGLLPFIPSELFKIALAVLLIPTLNKFIK